MKNAAFALLCSFVLSASALATIKDFGNKGPFSAPCVKKIAQAVDREDRSGGSAVISPSATMSVDDVTGTSVKTASITVNNSGDDDAYSTWTVKVRGTDASCAVMSVKFNDVAH